MLIDLTWLEAPPEFTTRARAAGKRTDTNVPLVHWRLQVWDENCLDIPWADLWGRGGGVVHADEVPVITRRRVLLTKLDHEEIA